jgi:FG-GAP-like repeat/Abnormal spindle-like microcephaly-assoc'd, ASPM-SPD-2-Hydin/FG-GAP repeat
MKHLLPSGPSELAFLRFVSAFSFVIFLLWASPSLSAQNIFTGPLDYVVGAQPNSIVVADFNGDGLLDFATANSYVNTVTVDLQNSDGTFQVPVDYAVGNSPASVQVADVNQDGKPDLLVVNLGDNTLSVLLGNGDGTFQAQKITVIIGPIPNATCCFAVADFNGDGKPDVAAPVPVATTPGAYGVALLLGNGDGTFQSPVIYPTTAQSYAIAAADFNNDGKQDIAAGNSILLGNGDGTFQAPISVSLPTGPLVVADFNQDGDLDIATSGITILYGNGDGTFQVQPLSVTGTPLAAGDLNSDGKPDLIAAGTVPNGTDSLPAIQSLLNTGTSTFTITQSIQTSHTAAAIANLKNGQPLDLLIADGSGGELYFVWPGIVTILSGSGDGTFPIFPSYSAYPASQGYTSFGTMALADFNGDGKPDLAIGEAVGNGHGPLTYQVGLLLNNGAGFASPTLIALSIGGGYPVAADFNGDGKVDLAVGGGGVAVLLGNGDGTFQPEVDYSGMAGPIAVGDFNNDGKLDVLGIVGSIGFDLAVILGNGNGSFGLPLNSPVGVFDAYATAFAVADFNQDGKLDVAALESQNTSGLQILLGNGDGTFSIGAGYSPASNPTAIAIGDLNGDGLPDIVVGGNSIGGASPSSISVFLGNGDGTFQTPITIVAGNGIGSIVIADFNLDGKQDVAFSNANWADVSLLLGNGDGTFQAPVQFSGVGVQYTGGGYALSTADFDGNGSPDIAVANFAGIFLLLSAGKNGSGALLSATSVAFGNQNVGQASTVQTVVLSNTNSTPLSVAGISVSGSQSGDFQQANACGTRLAAGANCTISVTFTPQAAGLLSAMIQITDSALNSPQTISLAGTGLAPLPSLNPNLLTFASQVVGTASTAQVVNFANTGNTALSITSIAASGDFGETNTCGSSVTAGSSCQISVTFQPTAAGNRSGSITIADNAAGSPQTVALSGVGTTAPDFNIGTASGSSTYETVSAGQAATFSLLLTPGGSFTGTVSLSCSVTPAVTPAPICSVPEPRPQR